MHPAASSQPVALITGASRGIGAATARLLAQQGYALVLAARSGDALAALAEELAHPDRPILVVPTDVCDPAALRELARRALERFGHVDVLIHNAGVVRPGVVVAELGDDDVQVTISTNLLAAITLTRALLGSMLARRSGAIIFVDSVGGHIGLPSAALYSTTKFALRGFAAALGREVATANIKVTVLCPGFIRTALMEPVFSAVPWLPMGRPEDAARAIMRVLRHPRREVVTPGYYRVFIWLERSLPWLLDPVARLYMARVLPRVRKGVRR